MRVALVHYWLVGMRGGEKVLEVLAEMFPDADIFTLVVDRDRISPALRDRSIKTSFLQKMGGRRHYQKLLPLMPFAIESFDLSAYDLVISSEAGPAKGVIVRPDALHICYCHTPMRYIWDLYPQYRAQSGLLARIVLSLSAPILRAWDVTTAARVDHFIANSAYVARRIEKYYRREATVIHPPVDVRRFRPVDAAGSFYLCAGQIAPYKKIDIAVDAFTKLELPLIVIGDGASKALKRRAGPSVTFLGAVDDRVMADHLARCRALVFPGIEDFGIVPLEAMASGRPVIAFAAGGALETVRHGSTGLLFDRQDVDGLCAAVSEMERTHHTFSGETIRAHAETFDRPNFKREMRAFIDRRWADHTIGRAGAMKGDLKFSMAEA